MFDGPHLRGHEYQMNFRFDPSATTSHRNSSLLPDTVNTFRCPESTRRHLKTISNKWSNLQINYKRLCTFFNLAFALLPSQIFIQHTMLTQPQPEGNLTKKVVSYFFAKSKPDISIFWTWISLVQELIAPDRIPLS